MIVTIGGLFYFTFKSCIRLWYRFFSRVVINSLSGRRRIGGIGFTVELDERSPRIKIPLKFFNSIILQ